MKTARQPTHRIYEQQGRDLIEGVYVAIKIERLHRHFGQLSAGEVSDINKD